MNRFAFFHFIVDNTLPSVISTISFLPNSFLLIIGFNFTSLSIQLIPFKWSISCCIQTASSVLCSSSFLLDLKPVYNIFDFGFYVSFFPQLVAGPIVRAKDFIPQMYEKHAISKEEFGMAIFWILNGLLKKAFLADFIANGFIDGVFDEPLRFTGFENLMAIIGYSLQVYADFSGYTDMAIGIALLLGF